MSRTRPNRMMWRRLKDVQQTRDDVARAHHKALQIEALKLSVQMMRDLYPFATKPAERGG